ncbi:MAG: recombinase RecA [Pirellulales bacterium]|nr:recombinase RecA [Pirellulales bacterium]
MHRLSTGIPRLDEQLDGGLLAGRLTVVVGATGIGKTQLGLQFSEAGTEQEGRRGIVFDMTARGDSQCHIEYAQRMFGRKLVVAETAAKPALDSFFAEGRDYADYLHIFDRRGKRVTRRDLDFDAWHDWQAELTARLAVAIAFFYGNFSQGVRRAVIDGIEPVGKPSDSIQLELFEYVYHQILRKEFDWVARDLFRERYAANAATIELHAYDHQQIGCLLLYTSAETMLEELIRRPLDEGDVLANANTIIQLGKVRDGNKLSRAMHIAKHRGSKASDEIVRFEIGERGIWLP